MQRKKAHIPVYSFAEHQRQPQTTTLYSPRVLILEGILALHDPRIVDLLDVKVELTVIPASESSADLPLRSLLRPTWMSVWAAEVGHALSRVDSVCR